METAYSLLTLKRVSEDQRVIEGVATTPEPDRVGDIVEPLGIKFRNPLPLLHQHDSDKPVGTVKFDKATNSGITFTASLPKIVEPGPLKDRVDTAWGEIKAGLVRAVSIGFRALDDGVELLRTGGIRYTKTEVLELSLVTVPANAGATITAIRSVARKQAASGHTRSSVQIILPPGVSGTATTPIHREISKMTTVSERIAALEQARGQKHARFDEVLEKALAANRTTDDAEQAECTELKGEIGKIDAELDLLRFKEAALASTATTLAPKSSIESTGMRLAGHRSYATAKAAKPAPGVRLARLIRCKAIARAEQADIARIAEREYNGRDPWLVEYVKAGEVAALSTSNLGDGLIPDEVGLGDFAEYLRPLTITGQFGVNGIPGFRRVGFRTGLASVTTSASAYWVGELKPKPLTFIDTARNHLLPLKIATILAISMEDLADSSPSAETTVRDELANAVIQARDETFIDPSVTAVSNVSPASITNDQDSIAATGTGDVDDVLLDLRALFAKFDAANNRASQAVLVMSTGNARALAFMQTTMGGTQFPGMSVNGGNLMGVPVITSDYAGDTVALISAGDVLYADDGNVRIDMSTEASLEMKDADNLVQHGDPTATGAAMVSMFQINAAAFRAEQRVNWIKRRDVVAPYLTGVTWGGAVPVS